MRRNSSRQRFVDPCCSQCGSRDDVQFKRIVPVASGLCVCAAFDTCRRMWPEAGGAIGIRLVWDVGCMCVCVSVTISAQSTSPAMGPRCLSVWHPPANESGHRSQVDQVTKDKLDMLRAVERAAGMARSHLSGGCGPAGVAG